MCWRQVKGRQVPALRMDVTAVAEGTMTAKVGTDWIDPALEPRYAAITPGMLMTNTSGLPGNDRRDMVSGQPFTGYAAQVLAGLR